MSIKAKGLFMAFCLAVLAAPALADDQTKTEKLWRIECSGIGG